MNTQGYNKTSIIYHWATVIIITALYLSGDGDDGGLLGTFHVGFGVVAGLFLFWRVGRRMWRGMPQKSDQPELLNLVSSLVIGSFLVAMILVFVTGVLIFWLQGKPIQIFGLLSIPSPFGSFPSMTDFVEEAHEFIAHAFIVLVGLHIAGTIKHLVIDRDGIATRMFRAVKDGR